MREKVSMPVFPAGTTLVEPRMSTWTAMVLMSSLPDLPTFDAGCLELAERPGTANEAG
jgi:hypothetical protein